MNKVGNEILKSIYQGKWLDLHYRNNDNKETSFWAKIKKIDPKRLSLTVDALNISKSTNPVELFVKVNNIQSAQVVDGSFYTINKELIINIETNTELYSFLFDNTANLKVLDYLTECNIHNVTPMKTKFIMVDLIDEDTLMERDTYELSQIQYESIVGSFQNQLNQKSQFYHKSNLGLNIMSISGEKGEYVLAYKKLFLDVDNKTLQVDDEITVNKEFIEGETKSSITKFLPEEELYLLEDFKKNRRKIFKLLNKYYVKKENISDSPYILEIGRNMLIDLNAQYQGIINMYTNDEVSLPIKAYFGEIKKEITRRKNYPITLLNKNVNIDQLLAIHKAMKYPLTYVQGPPGTGKTNTILNLIITAFFNQKTVLISSYNNHPMNSVFEKINEIKYSGFQIPFPIIRLGNSDKVLEALENVKHLYERTKDLTVFEKTLDKNKELKEQNVSKLSDLLSMYEERLELKERKDTINDLIDNGVGEYKFAVDIQAEQLNDIDKRLKGLESLNDKDTLKLVNQDFTEFTKYLNYTSIKYLKRLSEPKYKELLKIIYIEDNKEKVSKFNKYLSSSDNLKAFLRVFPLVITTNLSAYHLGEPRPSFDMVVLDEASQCDQATALIPIVRGNALLLVGDPQQLNPVIILDKKSNTKLMKKYGVGDEYNYIKNSIYKAYISTDYISDEILLKYHYRCAKKIIDFNNKKYYNNKLVIKTKDRKAESLIYVDNNDKNITGRNTSNAEVNQIISYIKNHPKENVGIITPFTRQRELIYQRLLDSNLKDIPVGTVHTFQGDQKDVILFSSALTNQTLNRTYSWLKNNEELINVATSRAINKLVLFSNEKQLKRLCKKDKSNDFYELYQHIKSKGTTEVTPKETNSRALGVKPYSSELEKHFMNNLVQALQITNNKYIAKKEVAVNSIFTDEHGTNKIFYTGKFDFVIFRKFNGDEIAEFAIELNGPEHKKNQHKMDNDNLKKELCKKRNFKLISVDNVYARKYNYVKDVLIRYYKAK